MNTRTEKEKIRTILKQKRTQISECEKNQVSERIAKKCMQVFFTKNNRPKVALYYALNGEVLTQPLANRLWQQHVYCFLPTIHRKNKKNLLFSKWEKHTVLTRNKYGIPESNDKNQLLVSAEQMDIILIPLLGFDKDCNRLGMGGGYYDKTLAEFKNCKHSPILIGLAYEHQCINAGLPTDSWDVKMNFIITESNIYQKKQ